MLHIEMRLTANNPHTNEKKDALVVSLEHYVGKIRGISITSNPIQESTRRQLRENIRRIASSFHWDVEFHVISTEAKVDVLATDVKSILTGTNFTNSLQENVGAEVDISFDIVTVIRTRSPSAVPIPAPSLNPSLHPSQSTTDQTQSPTPPPRDKISNQKAASISPMAIAVILTAISAVAIFSLFFCKTKRGCRKNNHSASGENDVGTEDEVMKLQRRHSQYQESVERDEAEIAKKKQGDSGFSQDNPMKSGARENENKRTMNTTV